jgi:hypothetical protein
VTAPLFQATSTERKSLMSGAVLQGLVGSFPNVSGRSKIVQRETTWRPFQQIVCAARLRQPSVRSSSTTIANTTCILCLCSWWLLVGRLRSDGIAITRLKEERTAWRQTHPYASGLLSEIFYFARRSITTAPVMKCTWSLSAHHRTRPPTCESDGSWRHDPNFLFLF